jgi:predicted peptidase
VKSLVAVALLLSGCAAHVFKPDEAHGFHERSVTVDGKVHRYQVYAPPSGGENLPVVLYLHGGGEVGSDNLAQTQEGLGPTVWRANGAFPLIVIFPQTYDFWALPQVQAMLFAELDQSIAEFHGDRARVSLTGNSFGGFGTWLLGAIHPDKFAALIPICGGVKPPSGKPPKGSILYGISDPYAEVARRLAHTPVWAFHGAKDGIVSVEETRKLVAALKSAGGNVHYTEFPDLGHESWDRAYSTEELWTWLAAQKLP